VDPRAKLLKDARHRASKQGVPFDLTVDDIVIPDTCPVLGIPLFKSAGRATDNSPSLDKIIPAAGYVRGNIVVVSLKANRMKSDGTLEDLRALVDFYELITPGHHRRWRRNPA
jgi:hypothetical protein